MTSVHSKASAALAFPGAADAFEWTEVTYDGRTYVTGEDIKAFYRFETYTNSGGRVVFSSKTTEMRLTAGTPNLYINGVMFHLSRSTLRRGGKVLFTRTDLDALIDPVLRPSSIGRTRERRITTVIIDPGHGGYDTGSKSVYGGNEKEYTLRLANILKRELERKGFRVRMTRSGDTFPSLASRVVFANRVPDALFISLHFNHHTSRSTHGLETFALLPRGAPGLRRGSAGTDAQSLIGNGRDAENIALATAVHSAVLRKTRARDRGIKRERFAVLKNVDHPAILIEGGFLSHRDEARKIASTSYLALMAAGIADACATYRNALRP